jgi:hypothetical protein
MNYPVTTRCKCGNTAYTTYFVTDKAESIVDWVCPECKVKESQAEIARLQQELERYKKRDLNAAIELVYDDGNNPFARESLKVVDVSVSDNIYCVESETLKSTQQELERVNRQLGKAHEMLEHVRCNCLEADIVEFVDEYFAELAESLPEPTP